MKNCENVVKQEAFLVRRTASLTRVAGVCLLLFALTVSGCSTIAGGILHSIVSSQERREIDSFCKKRCSELKGDDHAKCHKGCVYEEERRRSQEKAQEEADRKELEKRLAGERLKAPQK
jgi:hypothetical protein